METLSLDQDMKVYKGGGCNSIVLCSRDGRKAIIVDTKYLRGAKELRKKVTAEEIIIVNTHFHLASISTDPAKAPVAAPGAQKSPYLPC
jgi:hypothetical protein